LNAIFHDARNAAVEGGATIVMGTTTVVMHENGIF
jgi:hypothetical protein